MNKYVSLMVTIRGQIRELEEQKSLMNVEEYQRQIKILEEEIASLEAKLKRYNIPDVTHDLKIAIERKNNQKNELTDKMLSLTWERANLGFRIYELWTIDYKVNILLSAAGLKYADTSSAFDYLETDPYYHKLAEDCNIAKAKYDEHKKMGGEGFTEESKNLGIAAWDVLHHRDSVVLKFASDIDIDNDFDNNPEIKKILQELNLETEGLMR